MKLLDIKELKAKKDGIITPKSLLENALDNVDQIESVVYVIKKKDTEIVHGCSDMNQLQALGLFETGKVLVLQDMYEE